VYATEVRLALIRRAGVQVVALGIGQALGRGGDIILVGLRVARGIVVSIRFYAIGKFCITCKTGISI